MQKSPLRIFSYSCRRSEGRDTPACGWFQSSDWVGRTRRPRSRRTKHAPTWPGTREPEGETGLSGGGWAGEEDSNEGVCADAAAAPISNMTRGVWFPRDLNTRSCSASQAVEVTPAWTEARDGGGAGALVNRPPISEWSPGMRLLFCWHRRAEAGAGDNNWPPRTPNIRVGSLLSCRILTFSAVRSLLSREWEPGARERHSVLHFSLCYWVIIDCFEAFRLPLRVLKQPSQGEILQSAEKSAW